MKKVYGLPLEVEEELKKNWKKIRKEYRELSEDDTIPYNDTCKRFWDKGKWVVYPLHDYPWGRKMNSDKCIITHSILDKIPRLRAAAFSILKPKMKIYPHKGINDKTLRYHLGLIIPSGTYIRVDGKKHFWKEGKIFKFNDTLLHEVDNPSEEKRVILLFDIAEKFSWTFFITELILKVMNLGRRNKNWEFSKVRREMRKKYDKNEQ